jgi:hypothetical protein
VRPLSTAGREKRESIRKAGTLRGGSELSALKGHERAGFAVEALVLPASPPMASTGSNEKSELTGMSQLVRVKIMDFEGVENKGATVAVT